MCDTELQLAKLYNIAIYKFSFCWVASNFTSLHHGCMKYCVQDTTQLKKQWILWKFTVTTRMKNYVFSWSHQLKYQSYYEQKSISPDPTWNP